MTTIDFDHQVNTKEPVKTDTRKRLPNERDESPDAHDAQQHKDASHKVIRQAASDLQQGLMDTDLHGERGVEKVTEKAPAQAKPEQNSPTDDASKRR